MINAQLLEITRLFKIAGALVKVEKFGSGHINDTIRSEWQDSGHIRRYIHQRINHQVFEDIAGLTSNILLITNHLRKKIHDSACAPSDCTLQPVATIDDRYFAKDAHGNFWRTFIYIEKSREFQVFSDAEQAFEAGRCIGKFQKYLLDFDCSALVEPIRNFLSSPYRYQQFQAALTADAQQRTLSVADEIKFVETRAKNFSLVAELLEKSLIPTRVVHADTKPNNFLFDEAGKQALCLVDLDTCMPGYSLFDFADLARSASVQSAEDEQDLSKVQLRTDYLEAIIRGYLEYAKEFLNPVEIAVMPKVPALLALTLGTRFLSDHINGDIYFKISRVDQNLDRARSQFRICELLEAALPNTEKIVSKALLRT